jgi:sulfofructose kinase
MKISPGIVKITGFGVACMDYIAVARDVDAVGYSRIESYTVCGGGITGTSCVAASRLGADVRFLSRLGDDEVGDQILQTLISEEVDVSDVIRVPGGKSLFSWIRVDPESGERFIFSRHDTDVDCPVDLIPLGDIRQADTVLLDDHWPEGARYVASEAKSGGVPIVCDLRLRPANYDLMPLIDYAIISLGYALTVSRDGTVQGALRGIRELGAANAIVTCGGDGAWISDGIRETFVPAFPVDVVDTTGAGDVFHGAFAFAVGKGLFIEECTVFASAVAGLKCTGLGGRSAIPTLDEVMEFLERQ